MRHFGHLAVVEIAGTMRNRFLDTSRALNPKTHIKFVMSTCQSQVHMPIFNKKSFDVRRWNLERRNGPQTHPLTLFQVTSFTEKEHSAVSHLNKGLYARE